MNKIDIHNCLFKLLRLSLFNTDVQYDAFSMLSDADWLNIRKFAETHGVVAIVFDALDKLKTRGVSVQISMDNLMNWLGQTSYIESVYLQQKDKSNALATLWKENGINTMVFKGFALCSYYPVPSHREFGDFDCYLFGKYSEGNKIAEESGYKVNTGWYKHSQICYKGLMAENHNYFTQCRKGKKERELNKELIMELGDGSCLLKLEGTDLRLPPLHFEGLFMVYHAMAHFLLEGLTLRHICDWSCWMNANQNKIIWNNFYCRCKYYGFDRFVDALTAISVEYLGLEITNKEIVINNTYTSKILYNILYENSKLYNKGGKWYSRFGVIRNAIRHSWKYREIAQYSNKEYLWSYIKGFFLREEDE